MTGIRMEPRAEISAIRTGDKPTQSQTDAIMYLDGVNAEAAEEKYQSILEDEALASPIITDTEIDMDALADELDEIVNDDV